MLTTPEKILFALSTLACLYAAFKAAERIIRIVRRGRGKVDWGLARRRLVAVAIKTITFEPVFRTRLGVSLAHGFVAWAFIYYLLVNLLDLLRGFVPGFHISGTVGDVYRLGADLLSACALAGMLALLTRRFALQPASLMARQDVLLLAKAKSGIRRDSAIVGGFIIVHVGSRFLGESVRLASEHADAWQPFASVVSRLWAGWSPAALTFAEHATFWLALGSILAFVPYFLYSKHIHLFIAPLNFLLRPERRSIGEQEKIDFDDESLEQFGALSIEDLNWELILDAYACIMCFRCQEVCPAYNTGKVLSPAAMEINKRYFLNVEGSRLAAGEASSQKLTEFAISPEAVWACTACGACVDICPVGNEPMRDILDIRRALVLMENDFPEQLQTAYRGMERTLNPWNVPQSERLKWAEGIEVPVVDGDTQPEILWWVGCAPATDARAQKTARAFAQLLNRAQVSYAILGENEQCSGDSARRSGNEYLFSELAAANVELLNQVAPRRIVTTCPHCLHTLKNEYPAFGGNYQVIHHIQLISELVGAGRLKLNEALDQIITFHDPCYLGRHNGIVDEPRLVLRETQASLVEMPRHGLNSFCCGAGGAQMWKEEEKGVERVSANRFREAVESGAYTLALGCPFCMVMLTDAAKNANSSMQVKDVAEIVLSAIDDGP